MHGIKLFNRYHKTPLTHLYINEVDKSSNYKWETNNDVLSIPYLLNLINNHHNHSKGLSKSTID
jgi:hypothetical protein